MQLALTERYSNNFTFNSNYTLSKVEGTIMARKCRHTCIHELENIV